MHTLDEGKFHTFEGDFVLRADDAGQAQVTWKGHGRFAPTRHGVQWSSGTGEFVCYAGPPFLIDYRKKQIALHKGRLQVRGNVHSRLRIDLIEGSALRHCWFTGDQPVSGTLVLPGDAVASATEVPATDPFPHQIGASFEPPSVLNDSLLSSIDKSTPLEGLPPVDDDVPGPYTPSLASFIFDLSTAPVAIATHEVPLNASVGSMPDPALDTGLDFEPDLQPANPFEDSPIAPDGL